MSPTVALVASTTAEDGAPLLALRLRHLLERGWDAWLFCKGDAMADEPALRDPDLRDRVELAPDAKAELEPVRRPPAVAAPDLVHFHSGHGRLEGPAEGAAARLEDRDLVFERTATDLGR